MQSAPATTSSAGARTAIPAFIFVWATGYVVGWLAAKDAEALSFLIVRYLGVMVMMALFWHWLPGPGGPTGATRCTSRSLG